MPRAFRVKEEILTCFPDAKICLTPKTGGYFDILVNEVCVFSKTEKIGTSQERFPEVGEIILLLEKAGYDSNFNNKRD